MSIVTSSPATGPAGKTILNGVVDPSSSDGTNGDFYINTTTNYFFGPKAGGVWPPGIPLGGGSSIIPEYATDPVSPTYGMAWVLRQGGSTIDGTPLGILAGITHSITGGATTIGSPIGLLVGLTYATGSGSSTYQFSYQTSEGTTIRATMA